MTEERFSDQIKGYDIHTYFFQSHEPSVKEASELREKLMAEFSEDIHQGNIRVYKLFDGPIGPHPYGMWECDFKSPEIFAKLVPWFQLNHGSLSVLIHPRAGNALLDHTQRAMWIGTPVPLIVDVLSNSTD